MGELIRELIRELMGGIVKCFNKKRKVVDGLFRPRDCALL